MTTPTHDAGLLPVTVTSEDCEIADRANAIWVEQVDGPSAAAIAAALSRQQSARPSGLGEVDAITFARKAAAPFFAHPHFRNEQQRCLDGLYDDDPKVKIAKEAILAALTAAPAPADARTAEVEVALRTDGESASQIGPE